MTDENKRMTCSKGHTGLRVDIMCEERNWIEITCVTCHEWVWYNGA